MTDFHQVSETIYPQVTVIFYSLAGVCGRAYGVWRQDRWLFCVGMGCIALSRLTEIAYLLGDKP